MLPYKKRLKALSGFSHDLTQLLIVVEDGWFDVSTDRLEDTQIRKKMTAINTQLANLTKKHFDGQSLPRDDKLLYLAAEAVVSHFRTRYGVGQQESGT